MAVAPPSGYTLDEPELQSPVTPAPKSTPAPKPKKTVAAPKGYVVDETATHTGDAESVFEKNLPSLDEDSLTKNKTPPRKTYGDLLGEGVAQGAGSLVEGAIGNTVGMVADPINTLIHGGQPSLGTATREMLGLPDNPNKVVDATIQGGAAGLSTAGLAKGFANLLAKGGVGALSAAELGAMPGIDTIAGAASGFASGKADELGYGELGQLAAALGGGAAGFALAKKFVNLAKNFGKELVQIDDTGRPFVKVQEADGTYTTYYDLEDPNGVGGTVTDDAPLLEEQTGAPSSRGVDGPKTTYGRMTPEEEQAFTDATIEVRKELEGVEDPNINEADFNQLVGQKLAEKGLDPNIVQKDPYVPGEPSAPGVNPEVVDEGPDVVTRLTEALKTAGKAREDQDELYRQARAEKFRKVREAQQPGRGQQAYFDSLAALKGELPKADFEEVGSQFTQREVDDLFDVVLKTKTLTDSGKLNAHTGLTKVLNGTVPTPKELELLGEAFPADFVKEIVAKRGIISKSFGTFGEVWNLPKSAMSTFDLSAPFRQGLGLSNRKEFWKGLWPMGKYALSPKAYTAMDEWIKTHPTYALAEEAGLAITTTGGKGQSEDIFSSHIAEKIPGYGKIVQGSERAYVGFLNKLRFDTFNALVEQGRAAGIDFDADPKAAKGIANYINVMTGRGGLGKAEPAAGVLNGIFFSPRLISSRLQMLAAPVQGVAGKGFIAELPPELRMEAAKSYAAMTAMYATTLSLASFAGHQVTMDPLSSDFGKIKDGNTRIDAGGGLLQYITVGARALMRQSTSLKSGETRDLTGRGDTPLDTDIKFILNKMHPSLTLIADQQRGTNVVGEPFKWQSALLDRLTPMGIPDIVDTLKEHPNQTGMFYAMLGLLGYGLQNFDENATPGKEEASANPPAGYSLEEVK